MIFVFYDDDFAENGGIGLAQCTSREEAAAFISNRMATTSRKPSLSSYRVIDGVELSTRAVEVVSRVEIG